MLQMPFPSRIVRQILPVAALGVNFMLLAIPAWAFDGPAPTTGAWEISEADGTRKCRINLRPDAAQEGTHQIAMPAGCKRALPVLGSIGEWTVGEDKTLSLTDKAGNTVLAFAPGAEDGYLVATGPQGETYELEPVGRPRAQVAQVSQVQQLGAPSAPAAVSPNRVTTTPGIRRVPAPDAIATTGKTGAGAASSKAPPTPAPVYELPTSPVVPYPGRGPDLAGRYNIPRESDKDMGCLLTLDGNARGPGGNKAQLAPACRDQGIVVFDPIGWHFDRGQLVLTARKGHDARFQYHADGVWRKDPKEGGRPLGFKKI